MNKREFLGEEFYIWCLKEYETARYFLKNCGRPKDAVDEWFIQEAKFSSMFYKRLIT